MRIKKAFTLLETMISIIIVGILACIAIPSFIASLNRSYAKDTMNNLLSIQAAQLSYKEKNISPSHQYCTTAVTATSCNSISTINSSLGINIVSSGGITYNCSGGNVCQAQKAGSGAFTMVLSMNSSLNPGTTPVYCGAGHNPCCVQGTSVAGDPCP